MWWKYDGFPYLSIKIIYCRYSLESPGRSDSNEYPREAEANLMSTHNVYFYGGLQNISSSHHLHSKLLQETIKCVD